MSSRWLKWKERLMRWFAKCAKYRDSYLPLHPKFRIRGGEYGDTIWWQNRSVWMPVEPNHKVCFTFHSLLQMDGCPFLCKIALHRDIPGRYFGVAYPHLKGDLEKIIEWAAQFESPQLFTYRGQFLENLVSSVITRTMSPTRKKKPRASFACGASFFEFQDNADN